MKKTVFYLMATVLLMTACEEEIYEKSDVTSVTISESAVMLELGETATVAAIVEPLGASDVVWSSCDNKIATVNQYGGITAKGRGTTTILATTKIGGKVGSTTVYVEATRVTRVELNKAAIYLLPNDSVSIVAKVFPENATNKTVKWTSSDEKVATVKETPKFGNGALTVAAIGFGNATITATTEDGDFKATCLVTVSKISVSAISISQKTFEGYGGEGTAEKYQKLALKATTFPDDATFGGVTWTTSNKDVATVDSKGLVTVVSTVRGEKATIKAAADDNPGIYAECEVTVVKNDITGLTLNQSKFEGIVDATLQLTATITPANTTVTGITWTSSNTTMATVSPTGLVKIVSEKAGTAVIRATSMDKDNPIWAECNVTVIPAGFQVVTLWTGSHAMDASWGNWMDIPASWWTEAKAGYTVSFHFENANFVDGWAMAQVQDPGWKGFLDVGLNSGKGPSQVVDITLTQNHLDKLTSGTCHLGGYRCTLVKITITLPVSSPPEVLWTGKTALGNWSGSIQLPASKFVNAKVGSKLVVDVTEQNPDVTWWQFIWKTSGWADIPGFTVNVGKNDTSKETTVNQVLLDHMKNGLIIQGYMVTITKVTLYP